MFWAFASIPHLPSFPPRSPSMPSPTPAPHPDFLPRFASWPPAPLRTGSKPPSNDFPTHYPLTISHSSVLSFRAMTDLNLGTSTPQFGTAEYAGTPGGDRCRFCQQPIGATYYRLNDGMVCPSCAEKM